MKRINNMCAVIALLCIALCGGCKKSSAQSQKSKVVDITNILSQDHELYLEDLSSFPYRSITYERSNRNPGQFQEFQIENDSLKMFEIVLDSIAELSLFTYGILPENYEDFHEDYLVLKDRKINIDSLYSIYRKTHHVNAGEYLEFWMVDFFRWNDDEFILLSAMNRMHYRNGEIHSYLLIQMKDGQFVNASIFPNGYDDKNVFGDYNNDGVLDYLEWKPLTDSIRLYSLVNNQWVKDTSHYVVVEMDDELREFIEERGSVISYFYKIKEVKWFHMPRQNIKLSH